MTTYGFAGWMLWAPLTEFEAKPEPEWPSDPRPGWIVVRANGDWYIWNGRRWKLDNRRAKGAA